MLWVKREKCALPNAKYTNMLVYFALGNQVFCVLVEYRLYCAISIYKQTILPLFDYAGFLLISCNKKDRNDLSVIQNNYLRISYNVRLLDRFSLNEMHRMANLVGLEQLLFVIECMWLFIDETNTADLKHQLVKYSNKHEFRSG